MESIVDKMNTKWVTEVCIPHIKKNKKTVWSISAAITVTVLVKYIHRKLTVPPKRLRGLPCITYIDLLKSIWRGDTVYDQKRKLALPLLDKADGVFLVSDLISYSHVLKEPKKLIFLMKYDNRSLHISVGRCDLLTQKSVKLLCQIMVSNNDG